jgi:GMP reductase
MEECDFKDIYLIPRFTTVESRDDCNIQVPVGKRLFRFPVMPSNMKSVVNKETCEFLADQGIFYIMHRFGTDNLDFTKSMQNQGFVASISVGVNKEDKTKLLEMKGKRLVPEYITIDVANVFSVKGLSMIKFIKFHLPESFLIVGNCVTPEAIEALQKEGVDAIRVGISNGSVCTTYNTTGFGRPQFTAIQECAKVANVPLISDGGIREVGDIAKALVAGATYIMAGNLFAGYHESAGNVVEVDGKQYKEYFGSASFENNNTKYIEGKRELIPYKGMMKDLISQIEDGLKSSVSYAGGNNLSAFRRVSYVTK